MDIADQFGFHSTYFSSLGNTDLQGERKGMMQRNVISIMGYIPIVGIISGIIRIVLSAQQMNKEKCDKAYHAVHITRGVFEILGLGSLYLIPDLLVTAGRISKAGVAAMIEVHHQKWQLTTSTQG